MRFSRVQSHTSFRAITACLTAAAIAGCGNSEADNGTRTNDVQAGEGGSASSSTGSGSSTPPASTVSNPPGSGSATGPANTPDVGGATGSTGSVGGGPGSTGSTGSTGSPSTGSTGTSGPTGSGEPSGGPGMMSTGGFAGAGGSMGSGATSSEDPVNAGGFAGAGGSMGTGAAGNEDPVNAGGSGGAGGSMGTGGGTPSDCPQPVPLSGGMEYCSNSKGNAGSGYGYELWAEGGGSGCMTVHGVDATFSASWNDVEDFLARVGLDFDQTRTHSQIGTISAEFAETKTDDGGLTYIGIYGWTVDPLREFYILDDWGSEKPGGTSSDGTPRDFAGTFEADGETYDVWTKTRVDKPAITGDSETFDQYFSIRQTARQCGRISVSEHFTQWEALGLPLGNLHEVKLLVEAQFNSGSTEFTTATVVVE